MITYETSPPASVARNHRLRRTPPPPLANHHKQPRSRQPCRGTSARGPRPCGANVLVRGRPPSRPLRFPRATPSFSATSSEPYRANAVRRWFEPSHRLQSHGRFLRSALKPQCHCGPFAPPPIPPPTHSPRTRAASVSDPVGARTRPNRNTLSPSRPPACAQIFRAQ